MMKKIIILCSIIALLLSNFSLAEESRQMRIVNCESWASMRESADSHSERLAKVPLDAVVEALDIDGAFAYCVYDGIHGYILTDYLESLDERDRYDFGDYWSNFTTENCWNFLQDINERSDIISLYNSMQTEGDIDGTYTIVSDIANVSNGRLYIWDGGYILVEAEIEDRANPILREVYADAAEYFITKDWSIAAEIYDNMMEEYEKEYKRNYGGVGAYVEHYEGIGRYMMTSESDDGLKFCAFMGELQ